MRKCLILVGLLLLMLCPAWAQGDSLRLGYAVRGLVTDRKSGEAMEAVQVRVPGRHFATVTNADGVFVLKPMPLSS